MTDKPVYDWPAIRADYENESITIDQIVRTYNVSKPTLYKYIEAKNWPKRRPDRPVSRRTLINRMLKMLDFQTIQMEERMTGSDEKEVSLLGNMARTLEKLIDIDRKDAERQPSVKRSREMIELRQKLAARIDQLREQ